MANTNKVLLLTRSLSIGGAERQMILLAKALQESYAQVIIAVFYSGGLLEKELHHSNIRVISLNKKGRWDLLSFFYQLLKLIKDEQINIIHSYLSIPNIISAIVKFFFPQLRVVWGIRNATPFAVKRNWFNNMAVKIECLLSRVADRIIFNSQTGLAYYLSLGFPIKSAVVIPNGIDVHNYYPDADAGKQLRAEWGIHENEKLIGLVARLDPIKDHPTFLRAAALLIKEMPNTRFVCIGSGDPGYSNELLHLSNELGIANRIIWAGPRTDMQGVYNALDIATLSSLNEAFPNVIGEAMACGVVCVATDVGDVRVLVGSLGKVVPPADPLALAQGWVDCLQEDQPRLRAQLRTHIVNNFSVARLCDSTKNIIFN